MVKAILSRVVVDVVVVVVVSFKRRACTLESRVKVALSPFLLTNPRLGESLLPPTDVVAPV